MSSFYPQNIDFLPRVVNLKTSLDASLVNNLQDAITAIERTLGINPAGINGTIRARLDNIETLVGSISGTVPIDTAVSDGYDGYVLTYSLVDNQIELKPLNSVVRTITASYPIVSTDDVIVITTNSGSITVTMPVAPTKGNNYIIKDGVGNANVNVITINGNGKNIDGQSSYILNASYGSISVVYNGTEWSIL